MTASWFVPGRLLTVNRERTLFRLTRAAIVKEWRDKFAAISEAYEPMTQVRIVAQPYQKAGRLGDAGGHFPTVKAAIDGLVDSKVIADDDPRYVVEITQRAPQRGPEEGLLLAVVEI